jgi:sterol desaturase/sphingolipid hydroxylase (fatty acid hydroxylase superfamily)
VTHRDFVSHPRDARTGVLIATVAEVKLCRTTGTDVATSSVMAIPERWLTEECIDAALGDGPKTVGCQVLRWPFIDRWFARAHPAFPFAVFVPIAALAVAHAIHVGSHPAAAAAHVLLGALGFSLFEYVIHRFMFHRAFPETREGQIAKFLTHGYHHVYPSDPTRLVMPPIISLPLGTVVAGVLVFAFGTAGYSVFAGVALGYVAYDSMHYVLHHTRRQRGVIGWLRRYHLLHHFDHHVARFGVTTPLWDLVFGTFESATSHRPLARRTTSKRSPKS